MYVANDGGIFRTDGARASVAASRAATCDPANSSMSWASLDNGLQNTRVYDGAPYPDGTAYVGGDGGYVAVDPRDSKTIYAEISGLSLRKSTDGGVHWKNSYSGIGSSDGFLFIAPFAMDPNNSQQLWIGGASIYRTTDAAATWTQTSATLSGSLSAIAVAPGDSNTVAAGDSKGYVYVTTGALSSTAGTPWPVSQPRAGFVSAVAFDPANRNTLYATYSTFNASISDSHVYKSSDGGSTWTGIDGSGASGLPDVPVHTIVVNPSDNRMLFVGTDLGLYSSIDGGASWNRDTTPFGEALTGRPEDQYGGRDELPLCVHQRERGVARGARSNTNHPAVSKPGGHHKHR